MRRVVAVHLLSLFALAGFSGIAQAQKREEARLLLATQVLEELRAQRDQYIPDLLLDRAHGIAVFPNMTKAAFVVGGRYGTGVLVVRDQNGRFSSPVFIRLGGGSVGWQWGVQQSDIVLVFTSRAGIDRITEGKMTLGADASVAAGPVGRQASAATDATFKAEVYSYSRSRGLFAGVALDGSALTVDGRSNANFYGKPDVKAEEIIAGAVQSDAPTVTRFLAAVTTSTSPDDRRASAESKPAAETSAPPSSQPSEVKTFPMEDPQPGEEPR